jgi:hypothetical protein
MCRSRTDLASARRLASECNRATRTVAMYVAIKQQIKAPTSQGAAFPAAENSVVMTDPPLRRVVSAAEFCTTLPQAHYGRQRLLIDWYTFSGVLSTGRNQSFPAAEPDRTEPDRIGSDNETRPGQVPADPPRKRVSLIPDAGRRARCRLQGATGGCPSGARRLRRCLKPGCWFPVADCSGTQARAIADLPYDPQ